jgi:hypothetical protein
MDDAVTRRRLLAGAGFAAITGLGGCLGSERDVTATTEETYALSGANALRVHNENGSVAIDGADRDDVAVLARTRATNQAGLEDVRLAATRADGSLDLTVEHDRGPLSWLRAGPRMDLEVAVPADLRVERVETVNGDVEAEGIAGGLRAETTNGDVTLTDVRGDVTATTTNGGVTLTDVRGDVAAETTNGDISIVGIRGDVTAETTNGDVSATDVTGRVEADTTNGSVDTQNVSGTVSRG